MPDEKISTAIELAIERALGKAQEVARKEADRARNQAIGALGFFALILSVLGFFGGSALVEAWARDAAEEKVDEIISEYRAAFDEALELAEAVKQAAVEVEKIKEQISSGAFPGDLVAEQNQWGECAWEDFSATMSGHALERLGREGVPDYGCPDGTFITHIDYDDLPEGPIVRHTRCCKP